jgi:hypothetical protein
VLPTALASTAVVVAGTGPADAGTKKRARQQTTQLISRSFTGGIPNGPSTHGVISNDRRFARLIAFQSDASNIVRGDVNGVSDVFAVRRAGPTNNNGTAWRPGRTTLVSRGRGGAANGPSFAPAVSGGFRTRPPRCVAFLSAASNIARSDTNGRVDAFLVRGLGRRPKRLPLPGGRQSIADTTQVAISGDCKRVAFVTGGRLYVRFRGRTRRLRTQSNPRDPSFSTGTRNHLVFAARRGIYLAKRGVRRPRRIARRGSNPAFNDIKRRTLAYEVRRKGRTQIAYKDLGRRTRIISKRHSHVGNGDSRNPVIGNSGYYVTFESEASNLWVDAARRVGDHNARPDAYLFTDVRDLTLVQSVEEKGVAMPGGGHNPSMSFYANYILFDSPAPMGSRQGSHQVFMRWLGPV